jgi:hypothetical protein
MSTPDSQELALVKILSERFLKEGSEFASVNEILASPITALKRVNEKTAKLLEEAAFITTIADLVDLDPSDPFHSLMEGKGDVEDPVKFSMLKDNIITRLKDLISDELMRDIIVAARLISRAEKKQDFYTKEKKEQKILFLGLDNAGKTAIINVLSGRVNPSFLQKLKPTKRVQRETIATKEFTIHVWDLGGQAAYRESYLQKENLEMFFLQTDMIVYVIDMQDLGRLGESMAYISKILDVLAYLGEHPYIIFFLHKSDPDLIEKPEFQVGIEVVKDTLLGVLQNYDFDYDAFPTSIYYLYSRQAKFTGAIKDALKSQKQMEEDRGKEPKKQDALKAISDVLDTVMNLTANLAGQMDEALGKITDQLGRLAGRIDRVEGLLKARFPELARQWVAQPAPAYPAAQPEPVEGEDIEQPVPPPIPAIPEGMPVLSSRKAEGETGGKGIRGTMMDELKSIFVKRRGE